MKKKKFIDEFKEFAMKGNVIELAIGVVIGGAFGNIVNSLVKDIIMPLFSMLTGNIDFSNLKFIKVVETAGNKSEIVLAYGNFIQTILNFLIISFSIFITIKIINRAKAKILKEEKLAEENAKSKEVQDKVEAKKEQAEENKEQIEKILVEIRDLLKQKKN